MLEIFSRMENEFNSNLILLLPTAYLKLFEETSCCLRVTPRFSLTFYSFLQSQSHFFLLVLSTMLPGDCWCSPLICFHFSGSSFLSSSMRFVIINTMLKMNLSMGVDEGMREWKNSDRRWEEKVWLREEYSLDDDAGDRVIGTLFIVLFSLPLSLPSLSLIRCFSYHSKNLMKWRSVINHRSGSFPSYLVPFFPPSSSFLSPSLSHSILFLSKIRPLNTVIKKVYFSPQFRFSHLSHL